MQDPSVYNVVFGPKKAEGHMQYNQGPLLSMSLVSAKEMDTKQDGRGEEDAIPIQDPVSNPSWGPTAFMLTELIQSESHIYLHVLCIYILHIDTHTYEYRTNL